MHAVLREWAGKARFRRRWGFRPPPPWADSVGYEVLLDEMERYRIDAVEGDVLEIGALLGGGTATLCGWLARHAPGKRVITVDIFDPASDDTVTVDGWTMSELYALRLAGRDQRELFDEVTAGCRNLVVVEGDSTAVEIPVGRLAFAIIDGSHVPADVRTDFETVWSRLSPGGIVAFHDYGGDLPEITRTLHELVGEHAAELTRVWMRPPELLFMLRR